MSASKNHTTYVWRVGLTGVNGNTGAEAGAEAVGRGAAWNRHSGGGREAVVAAALSDEPESGQEMRTMMIGKVRYRSRMTRILNMVGWG